ncbi:MAG: type IV secretion protein IcmX [Legionella sp.]
MNSFTRYSIVTLLCSSSLVANAEQSNNPFDGNESLKTLTQYLANLGGYLGFDLTQTNQASVSQQLIDVTGMQLTQNYLFTTMLGATPVNAFNSVLAQLVPAANNYQFINKLANSSFSNYSNPNQQQNGLSANPQLDQKNYQNDPVNQAVLNLLGTPDYSYCMKDKTAQTWDNNCSLLTGLAITTNTIGVPPKPSDFFNYTSTNNYLSQLNSNTLLGPMIYSNIPSNAQTESTSSSAPSPSLSQMQQADQFIRYATGSVVPTPLAKWSDYDAIYTMATAKASKPEDLAKQKSAQSRLMNYLANLRVFAAQKSAAISNLYFIMSKRMPQNLGNDTNNATSQAMSEYTMASWRLFKPQNGAATPQWISQLNTASPATVQKEIATLLAEINYQMYLNRQQEERILLTNSLLLLQNMNNLRPTLDRENNNQ